MARAELVYAFLKNVKKGLPADFSIPSNAYAHDRLLIGYDTHYGEWFVTKAGDTFIAEFEAKKKARSKKGAAAARGRADAMRSIGMTRTKGGWE